MPAVVGPRVEASFPGVASLLPPPPPSLPVRRFSPQRRISAGGGSGGVGAAGEASGGGRASKRQRRLMMGGGMSSGGGAPNKPPPPPPLTSADLDKRGRDRLLLDYSQHFVNCGERPQNFIRDVEPDRRFLAYFRLKELMELKRSVIRARATPAQCIRVSEKSPLSGQGTLHAKKARLGREGWALQADLRTFPLSSLPVKFDVILVDPPWPEYAERCVGAKAPCEDITPWTLDEIKNVRLSHAAANSSETSVCRLRGQFDSAKFFLFPGFFFSGGGGGSGRRAVVLFFVVRRQTSGRGARRSFQGRKGRDRQTDGLILCRRLTSLRQGGRLLSVEDWFWVFSSVGVSALRRRLLGENQQGSRTSTAGEARRQRPSSRRRVFFSATNHRALPDGNQGSHPPLAGEKTAPLSEKKNPSTPFCCSPCVDKEGRPETSLFPSISFAGLALHPREFRHGRHYIRRAARPLLDGEARRAVRHHRTLLPRTKATRALWSPAQRARRVADHRKRNSGNKVRRCAVRRGRRRSRRGAREEQRWESGEKRHAFSLRSGLPRGLKATPASRRLPTTWAEGCWDPPRKSKLCDLSLRQEKQGLRPPPPNSS